MEESVGLGFHAGPDGESESAAASSGNVTTRFVSSSDSTMRMLFPPPPPHPSIVQQTIKSSKGHSLQIQEPSAHAVHHDIHMYQNALTNNNPPPTFQPPPGLPPPLSIPTAAAVPPSQYPPPPISLPVMIPPQQPIQKPIQHQLQQVQPTQVEQQNDDPTARARAIAQRFHIESNLPSSNHITSTNNQFHNNPSTLMNNTNYAKQRQQHFQNEKLKLHKCTLKNLEYIMKHEEAELRSHVDCMNEMTEWGERQGLRLQLLKQQQQEKEEEQRRRQLEKRSGGGIGSNDQRFVDRVRKREQLEHAHRGSGAGNAMSSNQQQQQQQQTTMRTSLYLSNLPTDGSVTERTLRSLFCVYGCLDRVTMYRNRSTGELKGDGLIVFGHDAINVNENDTKHDGQVTADLVETVCMQMNGAELPCGTVIGVEPADMDWGRRKEKKVKADHCQVQLQPKVTASAGQGGVGDAKQLEEASKSVAAANEEPKGEDDDDDLDDFFASLE